MSVTIQDNFNTAAPKPTDGRYGPYANVAAAKAAIPEVYRYKGLTVGVGTPVEEYWWADSTADGDLVQKTAAGNVTGITQGAGIIVDNTNPQIPDVSVDTSYVQVVSNLSTDVPTDGTSDVKYPSVKAVKDYADGLVVGLLNDRGNWAASGTFPGSYPTNPPATGSGPLGAILKGDIWFINVAGYLGTTYVSVGASVRALVDNPNPSTSTDWDIIDAGLGFTPENIANKVSTGANVNADPTSTVKYPSVRALVEYVQTYSPPLPYVPYTGATTDVDLGIHYLTTGGLQVNGDSSCTGFFSSNSFTFTGYDGIAELGIVPGSSGYWYLPNNGGNNRKLVTSVNSNYADDNGEITISNMITGAGSSNYIAKFVGSTQISSSGIYEDGTSVGIGTTSPSSSAKLQIDSTTQGFLLPRMTTAQMNAIASPQIGLMIFNTDTGYVTVYRGPSFSPEWWRLEYYCEDC
jgi:hypothetical protein